jgi:hypothetical protein
LTASTDSRPGPGRNGSGAVLVEGDAVGLLELLGEEVADEPSLEAEAEAEQDTGMTSDE